MRAIENKALRKIEARLRRELGSLVGFEADFGRDSLIPLSDWLREQGNDALARVCIHCYNCPKSYIAKTTPLCDYLKAEFPQGWSPLSGDTVAVPPAHNYGRAEPTQYYIGYEAIVRRVYPHTPSQVAPSRDIIQVASNQSRSREFQFRLEQIRPLSPMPGEPRE